MNVGSIFLFLLDGNDILLPTLVLFYLLILKLGVVFIETVLLKQSVQDILWCLLLWNFNRASLLSRNNSVFSL